MTSLNYNQLLENMFLEQLTSVLNAVQYAGNRYGYDIGDSDDDDLAGEIVEPYTQVSFGFSPNGSTDYQTGDFSFYGAAYHHKFVLGADVSSSTCVSDLALELLSDFANSCECLDFFEDRQMMQQKLRINYTCYKHTQVEDDCNGYETETEVVAEEYDQPISSLVGFLMSKRYELYWLDHKEVCADWLETPREIEDYSTGNLVNYSLHVSYNGYQGKDFSDEKLLSNVYKIAHLVNQ